MEFVRRLLTLLARYDQHDDLWWSVGKDGELHFFIKCSDVFAWGTADAERVIAETVECLAAAYEDAKGMSLDGKNYGGILYVARQRQMRPHGAVYPKNAVVVALFDACGPERMIGLGNPYRPGEYPAE